MKKRWFVIALFLVSGFAITSYAGTNSLHLYAPPLKFGAWAEAVNVFGFHGKVSCTEREKGNTTVIYEMKYYPTEKGDAEIATTTSVKTWQAAYIRGKGNGFGTAVKMDCEYTMLSKDDM